MATGERVELKKPRSGSQMSRGYKAEWMRRRRAATGESSLCPACGYREISPRSESGFCQKCRIAREEGRS